MDPFIIIIAIPILCVILIFAIGISSIVNWHRHSKNYSSYDDVEMSDAVGIEAEVISKKSEILSVGSYKTPDMKIAYLMTFKIENNSFIEYEVPKEIYDKYNNGDKGLLVTVDGNFFDFGQGE